MSGLWTSREEWKSIPGDDFMWVFLPGSFQELYVLPILNPSKFSWEVGKVKEKSNQRGNVTDLKKSIHVKFK